MFPFEREQLFLVDVGARACTGPLPLEVLRLDKATSQLGSKMVAGHSLAPFGIVVLPGSIPPAVTHE
jgi:hypothetical protein